MNLLTTGGKDINSLSSEERLQMNKLELTAGLPMGFFSTLKKDPKADIVNISNNDGQIQVLRSGANGLSLETLGTKNPAKASDGFTPTQQRATIADARTILASVDAGYQTVNGKLKSLSDNEKKLNQNKPDQRLSLQEYQKAVQDIMTKTGVSAIEADNTATQALSDLNYKKWNW